MMRASKLTLLRDRCPAALGYLEAGEPYGRGVFAVGVAAHDILWRIGLDHGSLARVPSVVAELISEGRGGMDADGPLPPDAVFEGRDLALRFAARQDWPVDDDLVWYELGIGLSPTWEIVPYATGVWFGSRPDVVRVDVELDEDDVRMVLTVGDYKTAWPAGDRDLDTVQRRSQAVAVVAWAESQGIDWDVLRLQIDNLRAGTTHRRDLWRHDPTTEPMLASWRQDLALLIGATSTNREKRPGVGCDGCPFVVPCRPSPDSSPGHEYSGLKARLAEVTVDLKARHADRTAERIAGGWVGYRAVERAVVAEDAGQRLVRAYLRATRLDLDGQAWARLIQAGLGVTSVKRIARICYPERSQITERKELIAECLMMGTVVRFGVHGEPK
jgi:hypothetical protein